jgi:hypothetical protein
MDRFIVAALVAALSCVLLAGSLAVGPGQGKASGGDRAQLGDCLRDAAGAEAKQECITQARTQNRERILEQAGGNCEKIPEGNARNRCMTRVASMGECWGEAPGLERAACAKERMGLANGVQAQIQSCEGENQSQCMEQARANVYSYVGFRFQGLSERAEALIGQGADEAAVELFLEELEAAETQFNEDDSLEGKKAALAQVRAKWQDFVRGVKDQV